MMKKTGSRKSRWTVPLSMSIRDTVGLVQQKKGGEWGGKKSRDTIPLSSCIGEKASYNVFYTG